MVADATSLTIDSSTWIIGLFTLVGVVISSILARWGQRDTNRQQQAAQQIEKRSDEYERLIAYVERVEEDNNRLRRENGRLYDALGDKFSTDSSHDH